MPVARPPMLTRLFLFAALLFAALPASAQQRGIDPVLVAEGPAPPGGEVELAIVMRTRPGWHGYWSNPGDAGLPMELEWDLPPGFAVGELRYPVPTRLTVAGLMNYVFKGDYAVLARLKVPAGAAGRVPIRAKARWLACTDTICVPEDGRIALDLAIGSGPPSDRPRFDGWRRALPQPLSSAGRFEVAADRLRVAIPIPSGLPVGEPYLFPASEMGVDHAGEQTFRRTGDVLVADVPRRGDPPQRFAGLIALGDGRGFTFEARPGDVPDGGRLVSQMGGRAILWAALGALAGGFLLNLMPCVFPILALKAMHLAKSGGDRSEARRDALAYTLGAIVGTGLLGVALLTIRAAGVSAGWAFQLQDPRAILFLALLAAAITANLAGLFRLPVLAGRARPGGSFSTGALAAFVATPCAGPFLGVALGTALLLPVSGSIVVFASLGLGLASPFLAIGFIPALRDRLPRPGPWMARLQRILAVPMLASALAALWLLERQSGRSGLIVGLGAIAALVVVLAAIGLAQRRSRPVAGIGFTAVALVMVAAIAVAPHARTNDARMPEGVEPWSDDKVAAHVATGRPAFVYFTADWCLTCKANEAGAIAREPVREAFDEAGVATFAADWTNGDPRITRFLEQRGRAGVPLYLWYRPGSPAEELPQVLTPALLIDRARASRPQRTSSLPPPRFRAPEFVPVQSRQRG